MEGETMSSSNYPNPDITDFLTNGKETLICSDFEGTMPLKQIEIFENVFKTDKQIIYLGDVFDNTSDCSKDYKNYCSLKMIKYLVDYSEKSRYVVGNRDINKIKIVPLLQLKSNVSWWADNTPITGFIQNTRMNKSGKWRNTKVITSKDKMIVRFTNIVSQLINNNIKNSTIWKVSTMTDYVPFWAKDTNKSNTNWLNPGATHVQPMTTLYERFLRIFGADTADGTMSAPNILNGVPDELFKGDIKGLINDIKLQINNNGDFKRYIDGKKNDKAFKLEEINKKRLEDKKGSKPPLTDSEIYETFSDLEIRSGIVFTIFMRMLDETLYKPNQNKDINFNDTSDIDGYLWKYLNMSNPALYAKTEKELFLFSHGGITNEFVNNDCFGILNIISGDNWKRILSSPVKEQPTGRDEGTPSSIDTIITKVQKYNEDYMKILTECFNTFKTSYFNTYLMILLTISAPAENNDLLRSDEFKYKSSGYTPIQPKQPKASILSNDVNIKIYNIWGHASVSFGYGFKKVSNNMYYISTDFSSSLYKEKICSNKKYYDENNLTLSITYNVDTKFDLKLNGMISINDKFIGNKIQEADLKKQKPEIPAISNESNINTILSSKLKAYQVIVIDGKMFKLPKDQDMILNIEQNGILDDSFFHNDTKNVNTKLITDNIKNIDYNYNGEVYYNGAKHELYSYYHFQFPEKQYMLVLNSTLPVSIPANPESSNTTSTNPNNPYNNLALGGYRKRRSIHKSKKNKMTKNKLYKKSRKNNSKKMKNSKKN